MFFKHRLHRRSQIPCKIYEGVQRFMTNYLIIKQRDNYNFIKTAFTHIAGYLTEPLIFFNILVLQIRLLQIKNCILLIFSSWPPPSMDFQLVFIIIPSRCISRYFPFLFFSLYLFPGNPCFGIPSENLWIFYFTLPSWNFKEGLWFFSWKTNIGSNKVQVIF